MRIRVLMKASCQYYGTLFALLLVDGHVPAPVRLEKVSNMVYT